VVDATIHQQVTPTSVCAGDTLTLSLSNLQQAIASAAEISLILVYNPNSERDLSPGDKGVPPSFGVGDIVLAQTAVSGNEAQLKVSLQSEYGPDAQGHKIRLQPGASNGILYLRYGGSYNGVNTLLCPAIAEE